MIEYWFKRMRVVGHDPIQASVGCLCRAIGRCDVRAVRDVIANMRFALARMEALCYNKVKGGYHDDADIPGRGT